jgi:hypothetical protein
MVEMSVALPRPRLVYEALSDGLGPAIEQLGLMRLSRTPFLSWRSTKSEDRSRTFLSFQVDSKATDPYGGGGFRLELERSLAEEPATGLVGRAKFFQLLTGDELDAVLAHQNEIIRDLPWPPDEHVRLYPDDGVREQYLDYFEPQPMFDSIQSWLRYRTLKDVEDWTTVLAPLLPVLLERAARLNPSERHLGKGSLLDDV